MERQYRSVRDLSMADLGLPVEELRTQNIDWLAQVGAQLIINVALEAEIEDVHTRPDRGR